MLNTDRIVSVTATDLITLYGVILSQSVSGLEAVGAAAPGVFDLDEVSGPVLLNEPLQHADIATFGASGEIYFVPAYDYAGISVGGAETAISGLVDPDGCTLYKATYADGTVTVGQIGPQMA